MIANILHILQKEIDQLMGEFTDLGKKAKEYQQEDMPQYEIDKIYAQMAEIAYEIQPVLPMIQFDNYVMVDLIENLLKTRKDRLKYTEKVTDKRVKKDGIPLKTKNKKITVYYPDWILDNIEKCAELTGKKRSKFIINHMEKACHLYLQDPEDNDGK